MDMTNNSNPYLVSSSSPYTNDILKFYEQMAGLQLQGRQKNYSRTKDAVEFNLERELEKLKTQETRSDICHQPQLSTIFHTATSTTSSHDIHFQVHVMDETRRVRNQEILAKLQELQMNASVFKTRSERLRTMWEEYEALVQKYSSQRKLGSMPSNDRNSRNQNLKRGHGYLFGEDQTISTSTSVVMDTTRPNNSSAIPAQPIQMTLMMSTGVNTDITGPVSPIRPNGNETDQETSRRVIGINNTRLQSETFRINEEVAERPSPMPIFFRRNQVTTKATAPTVGDGDSDNIIIHEPEVKQYHHFLGGQDLSTSESDPDLTVTRDKDKNKDDDEDDDFIFRTKRILTDETLSDSLSFSVSTRNFIPHLLDLTADSESTFSLLDSKPIKLDIGSGSAAQAGTIESSNGNKNNGSISIRNQEMIGSATEKSSRDDTRLTLSNRSNAFNGKSLDQKLELEMKRGGEGGILSDSLTSPSMSAAESFIDSTAENKTPDSLPRDESELEGIVEENEQQNRTENDRSRKTDEQKNKDIENESESDPEGTQTDVSVLGKMEKEIMEINFGGEDGENSRNKGIPYSSHVGNAKANVTNQSKAPMELSTISSQLQTGLAAEYGDIIGAASELKGNEVGEAPLQRSKENLEFKSKLEGNLKATSTSASVTTTSFANLEISSSAKAKSNCNVRLKLDYEDSESEEASERLSVPTGQVSAMNTNTGYQRKPTADWKVNLGDTVETVQKKMSVKDLNDDDDFDDFFDI